VTAQRYLCLAVPAVLVAVGLRLDRSRRGRAGALLASIAAFVGLSGLAELARIAGWWRFPQVDGAFRGMPVDLWLGWAALWGAVPVLARRVLPVPVVLGLLLWPDAVAMPALSPLVRLGPHWLAGELVGLVGVALPALLLGRWTAEDRRLRARACLQVAVFTAVLLWLVPAVAFQYGDGSWPRLPARWLLVAAQAAALLAVPGLAAVKEFVTRGGGTPYPWDPPVRLVTTGPYAYLANPMQASAVALLGLLAALARSPSLAAATVAAVAFSAAVAGPHERQDLIQRYGDEWLRYRSHVRNWWPRWRPYPGLPPASLWLDGACDPCAGVDGMLRRRQPWHLSLQPAARHDPPLRRAGYASDDRHEERGVAAVARALDHVNIGWAYLGWLLRMPGIDQLAQLVTDALIAPPHQPTEGGRCPPTPGNGCWTGPCGPCASTESPGSRLAPSPPPPASTRP
jgi:protein-S-isoprenylcysteine O-methyltransferase Ste14